MTVIEKHLQEAQELLQTIMSSQEFLLSVQHGSELLARQLQLGKKIMSCGNGGSMCDAMHFAEELSGRYRENRPADMTLFFLEWLKPWVKMEMCW
jgi:D-sedoheptulose 7-phosphate isomerase